MRPLSRDTLFPLMPNYKTHGGASRFDREQFPWDHEYWANLTRGGKIEALKQEGLLLLKNERRHKESVEDLLRLTRNILMDRLNNGYLKSHWIIIGSASPTALCAFLLYQRPSKVSIRTEKRMRDNKWEKEPVVFIEFKAPSLPQIGCHLCKEFMRGGVPHKNEYIALKFRVDNYGRVRAHFVQNNTAFIEGAWLPVP